METLRLVNSYGDAYGKADNRVERRYTEGSSTDDYSSDRRGATGNAGGRSMGGGKSSTSASPKSSSGSGKTTAPGAFGPKVTSKAAPLTPGEAARIASARKELAKMVGWSGTASSGISYKVGKPFSGKPSLLVQAKGAQGFRTVVDAGTRAWLAVAEAAIAAYKAKSVFRPSAGSGKPVSPSTSTTTTDTSAGAGETPTDTGSGSSGGASTPAWYSQPYLNEMLAISGWTGPSFNMPGVTLTVKSSTLDGVSAPAIGVTSSTGAVDVTPIMAEWAGYASNVVASKAEDDQRKASGTPAPSSGGSSGGSTRVTSDTSSGGYNIWGTDTVPSSEDGTSAPAAAPAEFKPSEEVVPSEAATLVSDDTTPAVGEESFLSKNKWYVAGGAVALLGGYAYMHRMNPSKYPLPDYLSKLVR